VRAGTGLGVDKPRVAVGDFAPRGDNAKSHSDLFTQVVRDDLAFSGILELVSPQLLPDSFAPPSLPNSAIFPGPIRQSTPNLVAFGNLIESPAEVGNLRLALRCPQSFFAASHRQGSIAARPTDAQVRKIRASVRRRNHQQALRRAFRV